MSKEEIRKMKKAGLIERGSKGDDLQYYGKVDGFDCYMTYSFNEDKLTSTGCAIHQPISDKSDSNIFRPYYDIKDYFIKKYGEIYKETHLYYTFSDEESITWDTSVSKVKMSLSIINNETVLLIDCKSKYEPELNP